VKFMPAARAGLWKAPTMLATPEMSSDTVSRTCSVSPPRTEGFSRSMAMSAGAVVSDWDETTWSRLLPGALAGV